MPSNQRMRQHTQPYRVRQLRPLERYAYETQSRQAQELALNDVWFISRQVLTPRTLAVVVFILVMSVIAFGANFNRPTQERFDTRYWLSVALAVVSVCVVLYSQWLLPLYRWLLAIHSGRYAVAEIRRIRRRSQRQGDVVEGSWQFTINGTAFEEAFHLDKELCGRWIQQLQPGHCVHTLLHPRQPTVLVAFGIIE